MTGSIDRFNEGEMTFEERGAFAEQIKHDVLLQTEVNLDRELSQFLSDPDRVEMMTKIGLVTGRNRSVSTGIRIFLVAASLVTLVSVAALLYLVIRLEKEPLAGSSQRDIQVRNAVPLRSLVTGEQGRTVKKERKTMTGKGNHRVLLASAFEVLPEFEVLVGTVTRSSMVTLKKPAVETTLHPGESLMFEWEGARHRVTVRIYTNHGRLITSCTPYSSHYYVLRTLGYASGLYYWKIFCGEELMQTGKVFIVKHH